MLVCGVDLGLRADEPGARADPSRLADRGYSGAALENLERKYGLDQPVHVRYVNYVTSALQLDFGNSFAVAGNPPVTELIARIWPVTFQLGLVYHYPCPLARAYSLALSRHTIEMGVVDNLVTFIATAGIAVPNFHYRHLVPADIWIPERLGRGKQVDCRTSDTRGWRRDSILGLYPAGLDLCFGATWLWYPVTPAPVSPIY